MTVLCANLLNSCVPLKPPGVRASPIPPPFNMKHAIEFSDIPEKVLIKAVKRSKKLGRLHNSITGGGGNLAGYIGQILVAETLGAKDVDKRNYDLILNGVKYEVKTKRCTSKPKPEYECSVSKFNDTQQCDFFVFVRVKADLSKAWILGRKARADFFKEARECKAGEVDEKSDRGWVFKANCWNLEISALEPLV